jgi:hypothetical protein
MDLERIQQLEHEIEQLKRDLADVREQLRVALESLKQRDAMKLETK